MKPLALFLVPFALGACAAIPATTGAPTATFGQAANAGPLRITPLKLVEDSRCPINARCIWAGRLILLADVAEGHAHQQRNLTLGTPVAIGTGKLTLVAAEPGKLAGSTPNPPANRFTFQYER